MTKPAKNILSDPHFYNPPVEAQEALIKKAHPEKFPGDVCLGIAKTDGMELLVYSENDSGGVCNVGGGLKGEKVGYVSMGEVHDFIKKYSISPRERRKRMATESMVQFIEQSFAKNNVQLGFELKRTEVKEIRLLETFGESIQMLQELPFELNLIEELEKIQNPNNGEIMLDFFSKPKDKN